MNSLKFLVNKSARLRSHFRRNVSTVRVSFGAGKVSQEITSGRHKLLADITESKGGDDLGPDPHDYLALSLGACTGLTLRMYAQRKYLPVDDVITDVIVDHQGSETHFERLIDIKGSLTSEQKNRMLEIAGMCPIHKALQGKIHIATRLIG